MIDEIVERYAELEIEEHELYANDKREVKKGEKVTMKDYSDELKETFQKTLQNRKSKVLK